MRRACGRLLPKSVYCGGLYILTPIFWYCSGASPTLLNFIALLLLQANRLLDRSHLLTA
ncbi:hypothetical protein CAMGR0001_0097 [Campylobacter gracilis RM3268]|uniref:Uncharacterized protein n=1 Tax=Campylobacter gracilis RM3268 TaxID=553220 RepID=C8PIB6_9BACT|nr:hypothetical protein CAMGR0001_0097 [Campylobacter gracilis RM3268]